MNHIELRFSANLKNEALARVSIASFAALLDPTVEELLEIKTIVSEAVSNAIIHGYKMNADRDVYIKAKIIDRTIELEIQDYGVGIENIEEILQNQYSLDVGNEHSGMGIIIMKSLADYFDIRSTKGLGTKVVVRKTIESIVNKEDETRVV